jgi:hypothetical protein
VTRIIIERAELIIYVKCALKLQTVHLLGAMDGSDPQTTKQEINFD